MGRVGFLRNTACFGVASNIHRALPERDRRGLNLEPRRRVEGGAGVWREGGDAQLQGLTLVHLSAQRKRFWWDKVYLGGV